MWKSLEKAFSAQSVKHKSLDISELPIDRNCWLGSTPLKKTSLNLTVKNRDKNQDYTLQIMIKAWQRPQFISLLGCTLGRFDGGPLTISVQSVLQSGRIFPKEIPVKRLLWTIKELRVAYFWTSSKFLNILDRPLSRPYLRPPEKLFTTPSKLPFELHPKTLNLDFADFWLRSWCSLFLNSKVYNRKARWISANSRWRKKSTNQSQATQKLELTIKKVNNHVYVKLKGMTTKFFEKVKSPLFLNIIKLTE